MPTQLHKHTCLVVNAPQNRQAVFKADSEMFAGQVICHAGQTAALARAPAPDQFVMAK
ncbi:hypothetical protein ABIB75_007299 [Bradyrhizobium sp. GM2.2]